jgi:outer membrane cobalamin receptor
MKKIGISMASACLFMASMAWADDERSLADMMDLKVVTASKSEQKLSEAPRLCLSLLTQT